MMGKKPEAHQLHFRLQKLLFIYVVGQPLSITVSKDRFSEVLNQCTSLHSAATGKHMFATPLYLPIEGLSQVGPARKAPKCNGSQLSETDEEKSTSE